MNDESKVDEEALSKMDVVKGTFSTGGQYQIIIGSGTVNKVFNEMEHITGKEASTTSEVKDKSTKNMNPLQRFVKMLSDIFCTNYSGNRSWWLINGFKQSINS